MRNIITLIVGIILIFILFTIMSLIDDNVFHLYNQNKYMYPQVNIIKGGVKK